MLSSHVKISPLLWLHNKLHLSDQKLFKYQKYVSCNNPRETRFGNGTQVKPCQLGLRTGWVTNHEYRLEGPYVVLTFLLLLFCVLCGVIVNSVLKGSFSIFFDVQIQKKTKTKNKINMAQCSSPENYYCSGRNTELKLCTL